jgi:hypothetical protein
MTRRNTRETLRGFMPSSFGVGHGFIYDAYGDGTKQTDLIITNPENPLACLPRCARRCPRQPQHQDFLSSNPTYPCIVTNNMDIQHTERRAQSETAAARAEPARRSPINSLTAPNSKLTICAGAQILTKNGVSIAADLRDPSEL